MILAIDIGNSATKAAVFEGDRITRRWRIPTAELSVDHLQEMVSSAHPLRAVVSSVVPVATTLCKTVLQQMGAAPLILNSATAVPIRNAYATPDTLGSDRLANAVGAHATVGTPCIIVSVGTAITIDVLDRTATFLGGAIMAGPALLAQSLGTRTAALPVLEIDDSIPSAIGYSTESALRAGILLGIAGGVEHVIRQQCEQLGYTPKILSTGGAAPQLMKLTSMLDDFEPDLALIGLKAVADFNVAKK